MFDSNVVLIPMQRFALTYRHRWLEYSETDIETQANKTHTSQTQANQTQANKTQANQTHSNQAHSNQAQANQTQANQTQAFRMTTFGQDFLLVIVSKLLILDNNSVFVK